MLKSMARIASPSFGTESYISSRIGALPRYTPDHSNLLIDASIRWDKNSAPSARVDAVAVPASRKAVNLQHAAKIARAAAHGLIILCSHDCSPAEAKEAIKKFVPGVPTWIIDMSKYRFPYYSETLMHAKKYEWNSNTALKRNAALLFARHKRLKHLLFLDDDVRDLVPDRVSRAVALLQEGQFSAAGWSFHDYPDNSAVSHAYRGLPTHPYGPQGCFLGGGGLLVKIGEDVPHFPLGIFNEDWFFLFSLLRQRKVAKLGQLRQLPYDPFAISRAPHKQEFGDCIAEGLLTLFDHYGDGLGFEALIERPEAWRTVLRQRRDLLSELSARLMAEKIRSRDVGQDGGPTPVEAARMYRAVESAQQGLAKIDEEDVAAWIRAWHADQACWSALWARISRERDAGRRRDNQLGEAVLRDIGLLDQVQLV